MSDLPDDATLADAQDWLRERLDEGANCPCCTQFARVYKRKLTKPMVTVLRAMRDQSPTEWVYLPDIRSKGQDEALMRHWGLIEGRAGVLRDDGSRRNGEWRLTMYGRLFLQGRHSVRKYVRLYNNRFMGFAGGVVTVTDVTGEHFDYDEMMHGE